MERAHQGDLLARIEALLRAPQPLTAATADAAVLVMLVDRSGWHTVFIRKGESEGYPWSGQIAFPGGRVEAADASTLEAALRELHEELAIEPEHVRVLGSLGEFRSRWIPVCVEAYVGLWDGIGPIRPLTGEIDWVCQISLDACLAHHENARFAGKKPSDIGDGLHYPVHHGWAWGLTARILHAFLEIVRRC